MFKKVLLLGVVLPQPIRLGNFEIHGESMPVIEGFTGSMRDILRNGINGFRNSHAFIKAEFIDELYRSSNPYYLERCELLVDLIKSFDIVIFCTYNYLHPAIIKSELSNQIKVLGFTDDPHSTYIRGIPYLWAFDAAYYISPSYSEKISFPELFRSLNFTKFKWMPLVQPIKYPNLLENDFVNRNISSCYVGNPTGSKFERIVNLKRRFGDDFQVYGRWPLNGYYGFIRPFLFEKPFFHKVKPISASEKCKLYLNTKIGFNMHVSDSPSESGNMRTYETAAFGMMPLCDRGANNLQSLIFEENKESIYYSCNQEAIELMNWYLKNDDERIRIAMGAYKKVKSDYGWEKVMYDFLKWIL